MDGSNTPKVVGALVISAALIVGVYFAVVQKDDAETSTVASTSQQSTSSSSSPAATSEFSDSAPQVVVEYSDGTYTVNAPYSSPGGSDSIGVELGVAANQVTTVSVTGDASNSTSEGYQESFMELITAAIVGQEIGDAEISKLGGASLTTAAFNNALEEIREQAKVQET